MERLPDKIKCFKASAVVSWQMFRGFSAEPLNKRRWWPSVWNESRAPFRSHLEGGWRASRMWGKYMLKVPRFLWSRRRSKAAMRIYTFKMVGRFCKGHIAEINHSVPSVAVWRMETHYGNWRKPKKCVLGMYVNCWPKGSARNVLLICTGADTGKVYALWGERVTGARDVCRRQEGLISHLQKTLKNRPLASAVMSVVTSAVWPVYRPLADPGSGTAGTYHVVQRLPWQTADTGGMESQRVCCLHSSLSSFGFELNLCTRLLLQNSSFLNLDWV